MGTSGGESGDEERVDREGERERVGTRSSQAVGRWRVGMRVSRRACMRGVAVMMEGNRERGRESQRRRPGRTAQLTSAATPYNAREANRRPASREPSPGRKTRAGRWSGTGAPGRSSTHTHTHTNLEPTHPRVAYPGQIICGTLAPGSPTFFPQYLL